jgi:protein-L-isoaspartate(D-aspartate) O-methyltransferase
MRVVDDAASEEVLALVYAADTALLTAPPGEATSSVSAPYLIAGMLAELDLAPGMRVLEIGAGSGYNSALIATLVGDARLVTTVDIDAELVERTRIRLAAMGFGMISVVAVDGDQGTPGTNYDRVVATVGCADIAPAWSDQLSSEGVLLVPLVHGSAHPRVKLSKDSSGMSGRYVGYSGFVSIQGVQAGQSPWPTRPPPNPTSPTVRELPERLSAALAPLDLARPQWSPAEWALGFYTSLRDLRAGFIAGMSDADSSARIERGHLLLNGDHAEDLAAELLAIAQQWLDLGAPGLDRYHTSFEARPPGSPERIGASLPAGPWRIRRLRHSQTVSLEGA